MARGVAMHWTVANSVSHTLIALAEMNEIRNDANCG
jgi:hypothetical protein